MDIGACKKFYIQVLTAISELEKTTDNITIGDIAEAVPEESKPTNFGYRRHRRRIVQREMGDRYQLERVRWKRRIN